MDRTRTVIARTRGFLSDGRKEDDGADKSAANLTRPFRFVGLWLARGWNVVVEWMENGCGAVLLWLRSSWTDEGERRTRERADEKKKARQNCRALFHGISPSCQPRRSSPPVEPIDSSELTTSPPSADVSPVSS